MSPYLYRFLRIVLCLLPFSLMAAPAAWSAPGAGVVTLEDSIQATLKNHRGLKVIQENRDVVSNELTRAKAGWGPRVDLNARAGVSNGSDSTTRAASSDRGMYGTGSISLTLVQPLWDGRATRSRVDTAEATVDSVTSRIVDNATTLALDAIIAHIDLLRRREILALAEANVRQHESILASTRDRESLGADTMGEVSQTEGRLARAKSTLSQAVASLREGENTYRRVTGRSVPENLAPVDVPSPEFTNPDDVVNTAKEKNPKVLAYFKDVQAAAGNVGLARSAFSPVVNLEAGPSYTDSTGPGKKWTGGVDVMGTVRWNLYNSGADDAEVMAAKARVRQSRQTLFDLVDSLTLEAQNAWTNYLTAREQYGFYQEAIGYNTRTRDAYLEQFVLGQRSLLDVLDAESELFNSSTQSCTSYGNILVSSWKLYALAGTLLSQFNIKQDALLTVPGDESFDSKSPFSR